MVKKLFCAGLKEKIQIRASALPKNDERTLNGSADSGKEGRGIQRKGGVSITPLHVSTTILFSLLSKPRLAHHSPEIHFSFNPSKSKLNLFTEQMNQ